MKKDNLLLMLFLVGLFVITFSTIFNSKLDMNGDNFAYLSLASGIAKGLGYVNTGNINLLPANHFPPGYSAFLAIFMMLGIKSVVFFKIVNGLLLLGSVLLFFRLLEKWTENKILAFTICMLTLMSIHLLQFSTIIMAEIPYLFFSVFVVWLLDRMACGKKKYWKDICFYLLIGTVAIMYYFRSVGLAMVAAILIYYFFRKEWMKSGMFLFGFILLMIPWSIRNSLLGLKSRYLGTVMTVNPWRPEKGNIASVGEFFEKMIRNFDDTVLKGFREVLFPFWDINGTQPSGFSGWLIGLIILALVLWGCWQLKNFRWLLLGYILFNIGIFMLWHGGNGVRYVVPIIPFVYIGFYVGVYEVAKRFVKSVAVRQKMPYLFLLLIIPMTPSLQAAGKLAKQPYPSAYQNYFQLAKAVEKQAPKGSVICCRKPELFHYFAPSMYICGYAFSLDDKAVIQGLIDNKVDFVVVEQLGYSSTGRYLLPAINNNKDLFQLVLHLKEPDTYLFQFNRAEAEKRFIAEDSGERNAPTPE